jgi:hypothetical protein
VLGQVALGDEAVGRFDVADAGQRQRLRQAIPQGAEGALGAAARASGE